MRALALFVVVAVGSAHAGVTLTFERTRQGKSSQMVLQLEGAKVRTVSTNDTGETVVVWDGDAKAFTTLSASDKTYARMDEASLKAMKERFAGMKAQMDAQMAKMKPEQRAQMEQMMKGRGMPGAPGPRPEVKVTPLNKKQKVGQFTCELYESSWGEQKSEVCVAPWDKVPLTKDDFKGLQSMGDFFKSMLESMPGMGAEAAGSQQEAVMGELDRLKGFPVQTTSTDPMGGTSTFTFKSAVRGSVDPAVFAVPAGYTEKKMGMGPP